MSGHFLIDIELATLIGRYKAKLTKQEGKSKISINSSL